MNDPLDGHSELYSDCRQNVFSSSWTAEKRDELPMWKIYTGLNGVRLRMPIDLFNHSGNLQVEKLNKGNNYLIKSNLNKSYLIKRKPLPYKINKNFEGDSEANFVYGPTQIEYYESKSGLTKGLIKKRDDLEFTFYEINLNLIGQTKMDYWRFEKEYRYRIFYGNSIMLAGSDKVLDEFFSKSPITTEFVDVGFKAESMENIEIILGPEAKKQTEERIKTILNKKKIKNFKIIKSRIKIL